MATYSCGCKVCGACCCGLKVILANCLVPLEGEALLCLHFFFFLRDGRAANPERGGGKDGVLGIRFVYHQAEVTGVVKNSTLARLGLGCVPTIWELHLWLVFEPGLQDEQWVFCPGSATLNKLYTRCRMLEGA